MSPVKGGYIRGADAFWSGDAATLYIADNASMRGQGWVNVNKDELYVYYRILDTAIARRRGTRLWLNLPPFEHRGGHDLSMPFKLIASRVGLRVWQERGSWYLGESGFALRQLLLQQPMPIRELFVGRLSETQRERWELIYPGTVYERLGAIKDE